MSENYSVLKDISYGNHERHTFDLFIPENAKKSTVKILKNVAFLLIFSCQTSIKEQRSTHLHLIKTLL